MSRQTAHDIEKKWRSDDIKIGENVDFSSLLLPKEILSGLYVNGFKYPSPIQLKSIPVGKIGKDLIIQAKSGTGKTLVFTIIALNMLLKDSSHPQVLIMTPTREIACQICFVIRSIGGGGGDLLVEYFIGGLRLEEDVRRIQGCKIVVGTPGRIKHLINSKILKTSGIRLFVLDEADQLLKDDSFINDIDDIFRALPRDKQMIATSATYPDKLKKLAEKYFRQPLEISLNKEDIGLLGMVHYYHVIPVSKLPVVAYKEKLKYLSKVLLNVKFAQCVVFCNMVSRVENLCVEIKNWGFATSFISSAREQEDRLRAIELLKKFKCKVLVASDVSSRGIDAENVDLVINFDLPKRLVTYFHRVGRAGRYGSKCASVSFITSDEIDLYEQMQTEGRFKSYPLQDDISVNLISLQPIIKTNVNEELPLDDRNSSNSPFGSSEDLDTKVDEHGKTNSFVKEIEMSIHDESPYTSKSNEFVSENLTSEDRLIGSEVASPASGDSAEIQNGLLLPESNTTNSVKEEDELSNTSESMELESDKTSSPDCAKLNQEKVAVEADDLNNNSESKELEAEKTDSPDLSNLKQQKVVTEVSSSTENFSVEEKNNLKTNKNDGEESCENDKSVEKKLNQSNLPKKSTEESVNDKALLANNEHNTFTKYNGPKSKELICSLTTLNREYENFYIDSEDCTKDFSKSINNELNENKSSKILRSSRNQFYCDVMKKLLVNSPEGLINGVAQEYGNEKNLTQVSEIEEQQYLKQNSGGEKLQNSNLDSQLVRFSTPKTKAPSNASSDVESSSGSDKDKALELFNSALSSIRKTKPNNSSSESSSGSESNSDTSADSEDAMALLSKKFNELSQKRAKCNKVAAKKNIEKGNIKNVGSSPSSSSSDSGTSIDSEDVDQELEQRFSKLMKAKRSGKGPSKDTEETKQILRKLKGSKKCFKGIQIVDTQNHGESSRCTSSDSNDILTDSSSSINSGKVKSQPRKETNKKIPNVKSKVVDTKKSSKRPNITTKTVKGLAENKITYFFYDDDQDINRHLRESASDIQDEIQRKTLEGGKSVSSSASGFETSSETNSGIEECYKDSGSSSRIGHQRKGKGAKQSKTKSSRFASSNVGGTSNPYNNPASERLMYCPPHSNYQMQPTYASNLYYPQYPQQIPSHVHNGQFLGTQPSHQMQPTCGPYLQSPPNSNRLTNPTQSNHQMQPSCYANNQCFLPSSHPCHPPNETCQSPVCAAWYETFYKQWQLINQSPYF